MWRLGRRLAPVHAATLALPPGLVAWAGTSAACRARAHLPAFCFPPCNLSPRARRRFFDGSVAHLMLFNSALDPQQVPGTLSGCVLHA